MTKKKKIALIGGDGFIGREIKGECSEEAKWETVSIDRNEVDLQEDESREILSSYFSKLDPEVVVVLAATKRQDGDGEEIKSSNNKITNNIIKGLTNFSKQVIYFSSCAVYGEKNNQNNVNEKSLINPTSHYGEHKAWSEEQYQRCLTNGTKLLIVRPPLVYSELETGGYNPGGFVYKALKRESINLWGDGSEMREFVHVRDIARITRMLCENKQEGVLNIVAGKSYSYISLVEYIKRKIKLDIIHKERSNVKVNHTYNNDKIRKSIGDYCFITPYEAIDAKLKDL